MKVSVILPTYNESGNIVALVRAIKAYMPLANAHEIVVVDDNSPDRTYDLVRETFADDPDVKPLLRTEDRGLARSIRAGITVATGDQIVVMDTDFTHDPAEIPKLLHVGQVYDVVSGSRFCAGGSMQDTSHYLASLFFNWFMRIVLRTQVQDNLGGYFTIGAEKLRSLPLDLIFVGYGDYFFRLIYCAEKRGLTIVEVPARYQVRKAGYSKSNFLKMLFSYTWAILKLKLAIAKERAGLSSERNLI